MQTQDMRSFLQVCSDGSINRAAASLFISPQGLSKAIKRIEGELGTDVFVRTGNSVTLTRQGEVFRRYAQQIVDLMASMSTEIETLSSQATGSIRLCFSYGVFDLLRGVCMQRLSVLHPQARITLREANDLQAIDAVWTGEVDMAVTFASEASAATLGGGPYSVTPLCKTHLVLVASTLNPLAGLKEASFADLRDQKLVLPNKNFSLREYVVNGCRRAGFEPDAPFECSAFDMVERICGQNLGVGVTFLHIVQDDLNKDNGLRFVPFSKSANLPLVLVCRSDVEKTVEMRDFELVITRYTDHFV